MMRHIGICWCWNLPTPFIFTSIKIKVHNYLICNIFMQWIYGALFLLRSVHPSDPTFNELVDKPILNVPIFTQLGSWECGNATS